MDWEIVRPSPSMKEFPGIEPEPLGWEETVARFPVPGGWMYRLVTRGGNSLVFVPEARIDEGPPAGS